MSTGPDVRLDRIESCSGLLARLAVGGAAGLFLLLVLLSFRPLTPQVAWLTVSAAVATAAMLLPRPREPLAVVACAVSIAVTLLVLTRDVRIEPSVLVECGSLLVVVVKVAWKSPRHQVVPLTVVLGATVAILPLRAASVRHAGFLAPLASAPMVVQVAVAIGAGAYLRAATARRTRTLAAVRQNERLELARDLHDFVAHHVTGIVVQAQAARFAAGSGARQSPEELDSMFASIEHAGTEALTSMRRLVGLLRDAPDAAVRPVGGLHRLTELATGFTGPPVRLSVPAGLPEPPPEIATTIHRVVQESLTNTRKHAADATRVRVGVTPLPGGWLEVAVRDDGQGRGRLLPSGRYGLAGLAERVQACGGTLRAGPGPAGGWEVVALLPALGESAA